MEEPREIRLKRLAMRSMRRGIKEMDLLLSAYADSRLAQMTSQELDAYESLLEENDQDLYAWITGQTPAPGAHESLVAEVRALALATGRG